MKALKIRGLVGSILSLCMSVISLVFLVLPMLTETSGKTIYSVFYSIININYVGQILGESGALYIASTAMMIVFALVSLALLALSITSLVGVCQKRYKLSMAISMRALSLIAAVLASVATTLLLLYFTVNNLVGTTFGVGPIISIAVSLIGVGGAFVLPSTSAYMKKIKQDERLEKEGAN